MILPRLGHVAEEAKLACGRIVDFAGSQRLFEASKGAVADVSATDEDDFVR